MASQVHEHEKVLFPIMNRKLQNVNSWTIDYQLTLDEHVSQLYDKAKQKISVLARISSFIW